LNKAGEDKAMKANNNKTAAVLVAVLAMFAGSAMAQSTKISTAKAVERRIVVSIQDRKLVLLEDGVVRKVYPVAVGANVSPSPEGSFQVVNRLTNPTYYHKGKVVGPGAQNPLGTRWMGLSEKGYGIHGTNAPKSIGKAASHGCIRMAKADLEQLFEMVRVGDEVEIRTELDETTAQMLHPTTQNEQVVATATAAAAPASTDGAE
jgi:lipoprotein-anchoring transpeptidase ErfK/SrfK